MRAKLSDSDVTKAIETLDGWSREGDAIVKTFAFASFVDGIAFVDRVALAAERANHHPDIDIRYTKIRIALSTHDSGGITAADVSQARAIQGLA